MAFTQLRLPRLQQGQAIVDANGYPSTSFITQLNKTFQAIEQAYNGIATALDAAGIASAAAKAANDAAIAANKAASSVSSDQALINSYISPNSVLTASTTTIMIAAHTRYYADGTSVAVGGGTVASTSSGDVDYVSYSDPMRTGGAVTYVASTTAPTQIGSTHVVGAITIPATGTAAGGKGPSRPGQVQP